MSNCDSIADMENNFAHRLGERIENIVLTMRNHGDYFFDKTILGAHLLILFKADAYAKIRRM